MVFKKFDISAWFALFFVLSFACQRTSSDGVEQFSTDFENTKSFQLVDSVILPVDTVSRAFSHVIHLFEHSSKSFLCILDQAYNSIKIYDLANRSLYKVIKFDIEGPFQVGQLEGFKIHNWDTIIVTSQYKVFLTDTAGRPFFSHDFLENNSSEITNGILMSEARRGAVIVNSRLFVDISPDVDFLDIKNVMNAKLKYIFDFKTLTNINVLGFPINYGEGIYPIQYVGLVSSTFNPFSNYFVYSFPAYPNLIQTDHRGYVTEYYAGAECCNSIPHLNNRNPSKKEYHQHYFTSPVFDFVAFDRFRRLYYRVVMKGMSVEKFNERDWRRDFVVIILNENLRKIGEVEFPISSGLSNGMFFICEKGLNFYKTSLNEDRLVFHTFKPIDIND